MEQLDADYMSGRVLAGPHERRFAGIAVEATPLRGHGNGVGLGPSRGPHWAISRGSPARRRELHNIPQWRVPRRGSRAERMRVSVRVRARVRARTTKS